MEVTLDIKFMMVSKFGDSLLIAQFTDLQECVKFSRIKKTDTCYQIAWIVSIDSINCIKKLIHVIR
jgi:hypothetical protein